MSPVAEPASGSYCMSTAVNSGGRNGCGRRWRASRRRRRRRPAGACSFISSGNRSQKMSSDSEMWSSAENTSVPAGSPVAAGGVPVPVLRRPEALRRDR